MMDKYKLEELEEKLDKCKLKGYDPHKILYMWVKQNHITFSEFKELIILLNQCKNYHCELYDFGKQDKPCEKQCEGCVEFEIKHF